MDDFGIVFNHHDTSAAAAQNLDALRTRNADARIFTVSAGEPFPGGFRARDLGEGGRVWASLTRGDRRLEWRNCDWLSYAWILNSAVRCRRWAFVGWDVYSTMALAEFLEGVWERGIAGVEVFRPDEHPTWNWFREGAPEELVTHMRGVCPVCLYFCSDECARAVAARALRHKDWDGFCELRLGTFAKAEGFEPAVIQGARRMVSWKWEGWTISGRGVWHPVKTVLPP